MIVLDENVLESQRELLHRRRIRARQIGVDVAPKGLDDAAILSLLVRLRRPTFFTRDLGFFDRSVCHRRYCIVCLAVHRNEVAAFVRRVLRLPRLDTTAKRLGTVLRVSSAGLRLWRIHAVEEEVWEW
ncbi:MAG TPA: hypothetical protein VJG13_02005 [Thermoanaerobaculia bacterium]|nr:hypothetical protein [Thermoanaerobaculia bacterium]